MTSRPLPSHSTFLAYRVPGAGLRLTAEEWDLIVGALRAYQHNTTYRPLYEKLTIQAPEFTDAGVRSGLPGSRPRLNLQVPSAPVTGVMGSGGWGGRISRRLFRGG